jgi:hypothetical protein
MDHPCALCSGCRPCILVLLRMHFYRNTDRECPNHGHLPALYEDDKGTRTRTTATRGLCRTRSTPAARCCKWASRRSAARPVPRVVRRALPSRPLREGHRLDLTTVAFLQGAYATVRCYAELRLALQRVRKVAVTVWHTDFTRAKAPCSRKQTSGYSFAGHTTAPTGRCRVLDCVPADIRSRYMRFHCELRLVRGMGMLKSTPILPTVQAQPRRIMCGSCT